MLAWPGIVLTNFWDSPGEYQWAEGPHDAHTYSLAHFCTLVAFAFRGIVDGTIAAPNPFMCGFSSLKKRAPPCRPLEQRTVRGRTVAEESDTHLNNAFCCRWIFFFFNFQEESVSRQVHVNRRFLEWHSNYLIIACCRIDYDLLEVLSIIFAHTVTRKNNRSMN